jgi:hypothetical protein
MNSDGTGLERLTDAKKASGKPAFNEDPTFSPDGRQVMYTSNRTGKKQIYIVNIDGTNDEIGNGITGVIKLNANAAVGLVFKSYSIGGKVLVDTVLSDVKGTQVYSTLVNGLIFLGGRF